MEAPRRGRPGREAQGDRARSVIGRGRDHVAEIAAARI
jgi:hypothetical protein